MPETTEALHRKFPDAVLESPDLSGFPCVIVKKEHWARIARALRADFAFNMLMDATAVDYLHWEEKAVRFEVVYNLYSLEKHRRLFVKVAVPEENPEIDTVAGVWASADWFEREIWDMFGIRFNGHPNLKRILMYEGFEGHALRKDYPYNRRQPIIGPEN